MTATRDRLVVHARIDEISEASWDALLPEGAPPFCRWAFLEALEHTGRLERAGWSPRYLAVVCEGEVVAAAPAFVTRSSQGDFSRDWHWAEAAASHAKRYYPKLVLTTPFTPATAPRLLVRRGLERAPLAGRLVGAAMELAREERCGIVQVLFCPESEAMELEAAGLSRRLMPQFHWFNRGYRDYDDWLATLPSKRRHQARRERGEAAKRGIVVRTVETAELAADAAGWARTIHRFYRAHLDRLHWGRPYLDEACFRRFLERMPEGCDVVGAFREGRLVAGAFNLASASRLYGRYWGCLEEHPFLHFHVCFYHSIDACIRTGRGVFEGGMDGEHKLARGFEPVLTHSAHAFMDQALDAALRRALAAERKAQVEGLAAYGEKRR